MTDAKAPAAVTKLKAKVAGRTVTLTWKNPADRDFDHVVITASRAQAQRAQRPPSACIPARARRPTIKLAAGQARWFVVVAYDAVGQCLAGGDVRVEPSRRRAASGPAPRAKVHGKVRLSWPVVKGAKYYNVQIYAGKKRVLVSWPAGRALQLPQREAQARHDLHLVRLAGARRQGQGALRQADRQEHLHVHRVSQSHPRPPRTGGLRGVWARSGLPIRPVLAVRWRPLGRSPCR